MMDKIKIRSQLIAASDDAIWHDWIVQVHNRSGGDYRELCALARDKCVKRGLRARAFLLALLPRDGRWWSPIETPSDLSSAGSDHLSLREFGDDLDFVRLAAEVVIACLERPPGYCGSSQLLAWLRECVALLPPEEAVVAFAKHPLNDVKPFADTDFESGYGPFADLLRDPVLPAEWKRRSDVEMRKIVLAEINGHVKPRKKWESAPKKYADIIERLHFGDFEGVDKSLLGDQILFVCEHPTMSISAFEQIIMRFQGEEWTRLRYKVARAYFLDNKDPFVHDADEIAAAESLLGEFGAFDTQLGAMIEKTLDMRRKQIEKEMRAEREKSTALKDLQERMRA